MNSLSNQGRSVERVAASWLIAGLALIALVGLSLSIEAPLETSAVADSEPQVAPIYAIDEDLAPLETGALELQERYADLVVPASYDDDDVRTGVVP